MIFFVSLFSNYLVAKLNSFVYNVGNPRSLGPQKIFYSNILYYQTQTHLQSKFPRSQVDRNTLEKDKGNHDIFYTKNVVLCNKNTVEVVFF
jgi:hypothetical protein